MPTFKVQAAEVVGRLEAKGTRPELDKWYLTLATSDGQALAYKFARPTTQLPAVGSTLTGSFGEPDNREQGRVKFIPESNFDGKSAPPRKRDPAESRRIERQHAQHMALQYISAKVALGKIDNFDFTDVQKLASAFDRDLDPPPVASDFPGDDGGLPPAGSL